jgi:hypothetical protein
MKVKTETKQDLISALKYLMEDHKRMFPEAHPHSTIKWKECDEVKTAFKAIRKAVSTRS